MIILHKVVSGRLSALTILKPTFVRIHTELEDQTKLYYLTKKKHRDEIFRQKVEEIESNRKWKNEAFLRKHADMAHMLRKASIKAFDQRIRLNDQNVSPFANKLPPTIAINHTIEHLPRSHSLENCVSSGLSFRQGQTTQQTLTNPREEKNIASKAYLSPQSLQSRPPSSRPLDTRSRIEDSYFFVDDERKSRLFQTSGPKTPLRLTTGPSSLDRRSPSPFLTEVSKTQSTKGRQSDESGYSLERSQLQEPPKKMKSQPQVRFFRKTLRGAIRTKDDSSKALKSFRESEQEVLKNSYLENYELSSNAETPEPEDLKFVFAETRETRMNKILKQKYLKKGVFCSSAKKAGYSAHRTFSSKPLLDRLNKSEKLGSDLDESISITGYFHHSGQRETERSSSNKKPSSPGLLLSQRSQARDSEAELGTDMVWKLSPDLLGYDSLISDRSLRRNTQNQSQRKQLVMLLGGSPANVIEKRSDSVSTERSSRSELEMSYRAKNPFYYNLKQKSMTQKKLHPQRQQLQDKWQSPRKLSTQNLLPVEQNLLQENNFEAYYKL